MKQIMYSQLIQNQRDRTYFQTWSVSGWMFKTSDSQISTTELKNTGQWYDKHKWKINKRWHVYTLRWQYITTKCLMTSNAKSHWLKEDCSENEHTILHNVAVRICFLPSKIFNGDLILRTEHPLFYYMLESLFPV